MPIYEFKCLKCQEFFELLVTNNDETELQCPKCNSKQLERVLSVTNFTTGSGSNTDNQGPAVTTRNCSSGSCTTYDIPGPTR